MESTGQSMEKKTRGSKGLLVASILIVCITAIFFLWWMNREKPVSEYTVETNTVTEVPPITEPTAFELQENFSTSITQLIQDIPKMKAKNTIELISKVEDQLVTVRVPSNDKEKYLNIFLSIDNLKKNETDSVEAIKTKIIELLSPLLQSP